jgi:hypothetical protein
VAAALAAVALVAGAGEEDLEGSVEVEDSVAVAAAPAGEMTWRK